MFRRLVAVAVLYRVFVWRLEYHASNTQQAQCQGAVDVIVFRQKLFMFSSRYDSFPTYDNRFYGYFHSDGPSVVPANDSGSLCQAILGARTLKKKTDETSISSAK